MSLNLLDRLQDADLACRLDARRLLSGEPIPLLDADDNGPGGLDGVVGRDGPLSDVWEDTDMR